MNTHSIGFVYSDKFMFIWNFWWTKFSLFNLGKLPFYCDYQYYPTGVSLALHDMSYFWSLLSIPCQLFLDLTLILNLFLVLCFPLNGLAFYYFSKEISKERTGSFVGSLLFAYCPYFIGRFVVGHIQYMGVFFIPLFLLELYRYHQQPRTAHFIKAGLYFSLTSLISYYYGSALILIFASFIFFQIFFQRSEQKSPGFWKTRLKHLCIFAGIVLIILTPFLLPGLIQLKRGDYDIKSRVLTSPSADLVAYFVPDSNHLARWRGWQISEKGKDWAEKFFLSLHGNLAEKSVYPGWTSWIWLIIALSLKKIRRKGWPWILIAFVSFIITLGPTLFIFGKPYLEGMLPCRLLPLIPGFNIIRGIARFAFFVPLGAGILLAKGLKMLKERGRKKLYIGLGLSLSLIIILEFIPKSTKIFPRQLFLSKFYASIRNDSRNYTLLNIPVDFRSPGGRGDVYDLAQTSHQKPIIGGYVSREPRYIFKTLEKSKFLQAVHHRQYEKDPRLYNRLHLSTQGLSDMKETLKELNIGYIILHKVFFRHSESEWRRLVSWIGDELGKPVFNDKWILVYSNLPHSQNNLEMILADKGMSEKAFTKIQDALKLNPEDPALHYELGILYEKKGELDKAIEQYEKALSIQPTFTQGLNNLAMVYAIKREYDKAVTLFKKIIELWPDSTTAYYNIACIYARQNQTEESIDWLKKAIKRGYKNWDFIKTDKDLENIRGSSYYKEIMRGH